MQLVDSNAESWMGRTAAVVPVHNKLTAGCRAFSGGDTEGSVLLKTGPFAQPTIARARNHSILFALPHLSQCSLKEAPSARLDFYSLPDIIAVSEGLAAPNETRFLWKLKFQGKFLAMTSGYGLSEITELHGLLI